MVECSLAEVIKWCAYSLTKGYCRIWQASSHWLRMYNKSPSIKKKVLLWYQNRFMYIFKEKYFRDGLKQIIAALALFYSIPCF